MKKLNVSITGENRTSTRRSLRASPLMLLIPMLLSQLNCGIGADDTLDDEHLGNTEQPAYYLSSAVWSIHSIPVCWENPSAANDLERRWVRQAAAESWSARADIELTGWGPCASSSSGIRIQIADTGPHTKGLGSQLNGKVNGMVLNFTFQNWGTLCQSTREFCIRAITVHEFGHALAFAHEQNRPDTPSHCTEPDQGTSGDITVGAWDLASVMNYCNPDWNGNGELSATDVMAVQQIYGPRMPAIGDAWADFNGDGKQDFCQRFGSDNTVGSRIRCTVSTGAGFGATYTSGVVDWGYEPGRAWVDFNGDGKADYCRLVGSVNLSSSYAECTVSTGTGFGTSYKSGVLDWGHESGRAWVDFNGDGKADYCRLVGFASSPALQCTVSTGTGFGATYTSGVVDWGYEAGRAWVDFNGDGKADYCRPVGFASSPAVQCTVSTGTGFGATHTSYIEDWGHESGRAWVDFNADGRADYCRVLGSVGTGPMQCTLSTGTGFVGTYWSHYVDWGYEPGRSWTDFNGDGRADYCRVVGVAGTLREQCTVSAVHGYGTFYESPVLF